MDTGIVRKKAKAVLVEDDAEIRTNILQLIVHVVPFYVFDHNIYTYY